MLSGGFSSGGFSHGGSNGRVPTLEAAALGTNGASSSGSLSGGASSSYSIGGSSGGFSHGGSNGRVPTLEDAALGTRGASSSGFSSGGASSSYSSGGFGGDTRSNNLGSQSLEQAFRSNGKISFTIIITFYFSLKTLYQQYLSILIHLTHSIPVNMLFLNLSYHPYQIFHYIVFPWLFLSWMNYWLSWLLILNIIGVVPNDISVVPPSPVTVTLASGKTLAPGEATQTSAVSIFSSCF